MSDRHPPADRRCQIYVSAQNSELLRCVNPGTRWVKWGGCNCTDSDDVCEAEFESWECDGDHTVRVTDVA
jgi:hypothetical protein